MDHCKHCANRGNLINCATSECSIQESWYPNALIGQIGDLQKELAELKRIVESAQIMTIQANRDATYSTSFKLDRPFNVVGETRRFRLVPVEG